MRILKDLQYITSRMDKCPDAGCLFWAPTDFSEAPAPDLFRLDWLGDSAGRIDRPR